MMIPHTPVKAIYLFLALFTLLSIYETNAYCLAWPEASYILVGNSLASLTEFLPKFLCRESVHVLGNIWLTLSDKL